MIPTVEWKDGVVRLLDQSRLPGHTELLECKDVAAVASAIQELKVRGAPAIGVTAAMGVALGAQSVSAADVSTFERHVLGICDQLAATRPTAVNLFWALTRMKVVVRENRACTIAEIQSRLVQEALAIQQEDIAMCKAMGQHGAGLIK
ncbi:MAG: S-methyl-5-thioribose-1-phosphate isomerase, partial [Nitrospira sp. SB0672_bin_25]|nr:S-methyl-5-thioribose-1-phosphate isomerase [Nitrospira sp. SB0672_bin_25]